MGVLTWGVLQTTPTMEERCPTQAILTLVVICFPTLDCTQSLRWAAFNGTIPSTAITLRPGDRDGHYFCRVQGDCGGGEVSVCTLGISSNTPDNNLDRRREFWSVE